MMMLAVMKRGDSRSEVFKICKQLGGKANALNFNIFQWAILDSISRCRMIVKIISTRKSEPPELRALVINPIAMTGETQAAVDIGLNGIEWEFVRWMSFRYPDVTVEITVRMARDETEKRRLWISPLDHIGFCSPWPFAPGGFVDIFRSKLFTHHNLFVYLVYILEVIRTVRPSDKGYLATIITGD
jgi:hypothetical protein